MEEQTVRDDLDNDGGGGDSSVVVVAMGLVTGLLNTLAEVVDSDNDNWLG